MAIGRALESWGDTKGMSQAGAKVGKRRSLVGEPAWANLVCMVGCRDLIQNM